MIHCPLCLEKTSQQRELSTQFFSCNECGSTYRDSQFYLSAEKEKQRYLLHENDVENSNYQAFVAPIVNEIFRCFNSKNIGLDFGAGTGPVISKLLTDKGYQMQLWDPFFYPQPSVLVQKYHFIVCCEVMEHFYNPLKEFKLIKSLLKPNGKLFCMTQLLTPEIIFNDWQYKNDPTHVIFYSEKNLKWIKEALGFSKVEIKGRLIIFDV